jgi:Flp pilus assembly protein TadG
MSRLFRVRRHEKRSRGQALVEFAVVFPIFALVLFGIIDVGRYVYVANALNQAAREGARYGSVEQWQYSCPAGVTSPDRFRCTAAATRGRLAGAPANVTVTVTCAYVGTGGALVSQTAAGCNSNDLLTVQVTTASYQFFTPVIGQLIGSPTIRGQTQVVVQ